jgi:CheY-like chemotaxis protein
MIKAIVKESLKLLRATIPTTIEIRQEISPSCGAVTGDATEIHQVLMNLCTNAAYAMRQTGGVLEVTLQNVNIEEEDAVNYVELAPGPYVRLTVSDTGCGIDSHNLEKIFDPFYTTKKKGEGTGMGLSVVHGIISNYGGAVLVYSQPDQGTTFQVLFPRTVTGKFDAKTAPLPIPGGSERILFVDDDVFLVKMGRTMLENLGYQVVALSDSAEALKIFEAQSDKFDLVLTDQTMPRMTGVQLSKKLMAVRPDIPIILCTGFSELITPEEVRIMGIREFIMKPFVRRDLAETIRKVLDDTKN